MARHVDILTIDFETRSTVDIKTAGAWNYARDPSTDILCLAYKLPGRFVKIWTPAEGFPSDLYEYLYIEKRPVEAHNVFFERVIWEFVGRPRYGFPDVLPEQWRCSAAKACVHGLPRHLAGACEVMGTRAQKDKTGYNLMMRLCKPRTLTKAEVIEMHERETGVTLDKRKWTKKRVDSVRADLEKAYGPFWNDDPADLRRLALYCGRDVLAEHALSSALNDLTDTELKIFQLTQEMNWRGVYCDLDCAEASVKVMAELKDIAETELSELTDGAVTTVNQGARIVKWAGENGYPIKDCRKPTIVDALADEKCPDEVKKVLRIRQLYGRSSVAKYQSILDRADRADARVRDHQRYHGARTGRLAAQGIQTQNFPRPDKGLKFEQIMNSIQVVKTRDAELYDMLYDNPAGMLSAAIRPTICAAPGSTLICIDYSSIEAVLTLWFCGDPGLQLFRDGKCLYKDLAGQLYGLDDPQTLAKGSVERQHGKIGVLSCGYGAGWKTVQSSAKTMFDIVLPEIDSKKIVDAYRSKYTKVPETWKRLQKAFLTCIHRKTNVNVDNVGFEYGDPFIKLRLPSGRYLYYYKPFIQMEVAPWGDEVPCIYYWREDSQTKQWTPTKTYGGKILENIIQAIARDIMCDAWLKISDRIWFETKLVMTVHDELVFEVPEGANPELQCKETCKVMKTPPPWAADCPIDVEAWIGRNYRK